MLWQRFPLLQYVVLRRDSLHSWHAAILQTNQTLLQQRLRVRLRMTFSSNGWQAVGRNQWPTHTPEYATLQARAPVVTPSEYRVSRWCADRG